jgi:hypothetical protein
MKPKRSWDTPVSDWTLRYQLELERRDKHDGPLIACTADERLLDKILSDDSMTWPVFLAWSEERVYFPVRGSDYYFDVASAPRNPRAEGQEWVG